MSPDVGFLFVISQNLFTFLKWGWVNQSQSIYICGVFAASLPCHFPAIYQGKCHMIALCLNFKGAPDCVHKELHFLHSYQQSLGSQRVRHHWVTNTHTHQQSITIPVSPYPQQHLWLFVFLFITVILDMSWCLVCIYLILEILSIFTCAYWSFLLLILENIYSDPFLSFFFFFRTALCIFIIELGKLCHDFCRFVYFALVNHLLLFESE